ncbi:maltose regulon periplasmic protein [Citrobacter koseri]|uniref:Maltose regulon periplasmic protein n=1 Tax=Citrobacter koseri TaxID=545 RepID=A0A2X2W857_CITKO|nr:maltose regulon periplasmic protein [Citrobacter koseri]
MKMKKSLVALCLSAGLLASAPGISLADVNYVPQNTSAAPAIPTAALQQLTWTPVDQSSTQSTQLSTGGQRLDVAGITGPVAAYSVPANIGELTLTLSSEVNKQTSVFAPNVLILDQNLTPSAFFPSSYFTYQAPGVMSADRLEGVMRLTPALVSRSCTFWCLLPITISSRPPRCLTRQKRMRKAWVMPSRIFPIRSRATRLMAC